MPALRATDLDTLALIERPHMNSHLDTGASTPETLSTSNDHCDEHRPALAHPFDDLPLNSELAPAPRDRMSDEEVDHFPMPTPDQVARSMARALKFREVNKHQEERDRQIAEGRKMARFENQAPRLAHEHKAANRHPHPHPHPQQALAEGQVPAKKRRNRNRNKNKNFVRPSAPSPVFVAH
jgi:hypothetical protein